MQQKQLGVALVQSTNNAERILSFAKDTRLLGTENGHTALHQTPMEEVMKNVEYSMNTIRGPLEFIHYIFIIVNASRAFTHQLVRHRVSSFAQQSLRVSDNVGYYTPPGIAHKLEAHQLYDAHVLESKNVYDQLVDMGIEMQDARGVLPIHATSAILMKVNLRAFLEMLEIRLCLRVQGENRSAMIQMKDLVSDIHPWAADHMGPLCRTKGICAFPRYECPVSNAYPELKGMPEDRKREVGQLVESFKAKGLQPRTQGAK